jgi:hypothetical protein
MNLLITYSFGLLQETVRIPYLFCRGDSLIPPYWSVNQGTRLGRPCAELGTTTWRYMVEWRSTSTHCNLGTRRRWMTIFTLRPRNPWGKMPPVLKA